MIGLFIYHEKRIKSILSNWAADNGVQIMKISSGLFRRCPFFLTLGRQEVYYIVVRERDGRVRGCWVRIGDFLFGSLFTDVVEAKWVNGDSNIP
jgi:hypothetical protein